ITGWRRGCVIRGQTTEDRRQKKPFSVRPDFVFLKLRTAVFVDGCFWHGCPKHATQPKTNARFWRDNAVRQHGDGHTAGVAPELLRRVSACGCWAQALTNRHQQGPRSAVAGPMADKPPRKFRPAETRLDCAPRVGTRAPPKG
ncbi:MAG: hypothetical protein KA788_13170, partial [Lacunisphaera sp.]|nr:hypothetical protein [Lacunisphaera sp.]